MWGPSVSVAPAGLARQAICGRGSLTLDVSTVRVCPLLALLAHSLLRAGVCKACGSRDSAGGGRLAHFQQQFAKDLDPTSPSAPQTLGEMTDRLKVGWVAMGGRVLGRWWSLPSQAHPCAPSPLSFSFFPLSCHSCLGRAAPPQGWRMLLESMIDHEYPLAMKMEVEAPMVSGAIQGKGGQRRFTLVWYVCWGGGEGLLAMTWRRPWRVEL